MFYLRTPPLLHDLSILLARHPLSCHYSPPPHQGQNPTLAHSRGVYGLTGLAVIDTKKLVPQENGRRFIAVLQ